MNAHAHKGFEGSTTSQDRLPNRRCLMEIVQSDTFTLHGDTEIRFQAQIVGGEYEGRLVDFGMTVTRQFEVDEEGYETETERGETGDREYAAIRWATGVFDPQDTSDLHGKLFAASVGYRNGSYRVDGFDRPRAYDAPAPKQTKATPPRGPDGRFLPRGHAVAEAGVEEADQPESAANSTTPSEPEAVPYERWSEAWQRADRYNVLTHNISMLWRLLSPKIEDDLGRATGPLNGLLKGGGEGLYVLAKEDVEVLDYHLLKLGELIDDLVAVDAK
ncbi:MAG: hypothetical protein J0J10_09520 [Bosea sp.]|uniref:hypothetical protein n=1 Tax=Bosea sp. (in: a-proteobacteria) TaxID=1871050 RepID=UPI001AC7947D|nr:hypothetical protein [Bosea sp. (in: a-proteobacteria)]MBN9468997.1 hypothetical protein [Bosea sp. (in: a-proteobacteria)]